MIGRYEYTAENGQRVVGDFNTSAWAIGLGIGVEFDFYGQSRNLETFFGKGVDASGELFFVSISASLDSDTQESVGAGLGFVVMPIRFTDTKLDGAPKVSGSPCSETG